MHAYNDSNFHRCGLCTSLSNAFNVSLMYVLNKSLVVLDDHYLYVHDKMSRDTRKLVFRVRLVMEFWTLLIKHIIMRFIIICL